MPDSADSQPKSNTKPVAPKPGRDATGLFAPGNRIGFQPGQSGNPAGRRPGVSFAAALGRQAVSRVRGREELERIAETIGLDAKEARSIDVVASLYFLVLCRLLLRAADRKGRADDRLVGMLQVLLKALDPQEIRVSGPGGGPIPIAVAVANVQAALGMQQDGTPALPEIDLPTVEAVLEGTQSDEVACLPTVPEQEDEAAGGAG